MACIIGAAMCGIGLGITFNYNGSTGGTDIIAAIRAILTVSTILSCPVFAFALINYTSGAGSDGWNFLLISSNIHFHIFLKASKNVT